MASNTPRTVCRKKGGKFVSAGELKRREICSKRCKVLQSEIQCEVSIEKKCSESREARHEEITWADGRRVVELQVLAEGLKSCSDCNQPLHLRNISSEKRYGLASVLTITCSNCAQLNSVYTGKSHRSAGATRGVPIYDVNTKLATGIVLLFYLS